MSNSVKGINLLPNEYIVAQKINFIEKIVGSLCVIELACFVAFVALPPKQEVKRTENILLEKRMQVTSERYAGVNKALEELNQTKTAIDGWNNAYKNIKLTGFINDEVLDELVSRVPVGVYIESLKIADESGDEGEKNITITGACESTEAANSYFAYLETLYKGSDIQNKADNGGGEEANSLGKFDVTIKIPAKPVEQPAAVAEAVDGEEGASEPVDNGEGANS